MSEIVDHYILSPDKIKSPPRTFRGRLKFLGPSFILSASIVGSGELIATMTLGAKAGFITLWVIIVSCIVKVAVQLEFGKHIILKGEKAMQAFNKLSVLMIITGGIIGSFLLFLVVYAVIHFRYVRLNPLFKPGIYCDLALCLSILSIMAVGVLGILKFFS